ncbi:MAG: O-antigen ligase family protein [Flavobacterium sp.]|nr:O-antigen ligase family protein [Flavobacterium sp.]
MQSKEKNYLFLIILHFFIGVCVFAIPFFSKIYFVLIIIGSLYFIVKTQNKNNEVLYVAAYIVGSEVLLRMTDSSPIYEFGKYGVFFSVLFGMYYSGISSKAIPYWIFLLLLVPGVIIGTQTLNLTTLDIRKTIIFNISGPICLGFASLYCFNRRVTISELSNILLMIGLPVFSTAIFLFFSTPDLKEALNGTNSNYATSGGFGPNQVSTILGLGMFIFFSRVLLASKTKLFLVINLSIAIYIGFRTLITFSRGGMLTGVIMTIILMFFSFIYSTNQGKTKLRYLLFFSVIIFSSLWIYTETKTDGLIGKRYANKDAIGRTKVSKFSGREDIAASEIKAFLENPFFGIGVAKGTEYRLEDLGFVVASHDELTRMLAEHGSFGVLALLILFFTPIFFLLDNKQNIFIFCFLIFWLLTINHAAMRIAASAFVYSLSLLKVNFNEEDEKPIIHR